MRMIYRSLFHGNSNLVGGIIAGVVILSIALGCNCDKNFDLANLGNSSNKSSTSNSTDSPTTADGTVPSDSVVEALVKETLAGFADAVDSGDFSELHEQASTDFQSSYTPDEMKTAFKSYTDKKSLVLPILRKVDNEDAEFTTEPYIRTEKSLKILVANGKFPTKPLGVRFEYEYVMRGGEWKLLKLVTNIP